MSGGAATMNRLKPVNALYPTAKAGGLYGVSRKRDLGRCFRKVGFEPVGYTTRGLLDLRLSLSLLQQIVGQGAQETAPVQLALGLETDKAS